MDSVEVTVTAGLSVIYRDDARNSTREQIGSILCIVRPG